MSGSASKNKGKSGERELCKILGGTFGGNFMRVPNSGAYVGGQNSKRKEVLSEGQIILMKGDIIPPDFMPKFVLESKFYKDFPFHSLVSNANIPVLNCWIEQCKECIDRGDFWLVCFKINRKGWFAAFSFEHYKDFALKNHSIYTDLHRDQFIITDLNSFLVLNKEKILRLTS